MVWGRHGGHYGGGWSAPRAFHWYPSRGRAQTVIIEKQQQQPVQQVSMSDGEKTGLIVGAVAVGVIGIGALAYLAMKK